MSSKKENEVKKSSTSKKVGQNKELFPRPKFGSAVCLNNTFANHSVARTKCKSLPSLIVPFVDYESEIDIEYSNYLQSLAFQHHFSNQIDELQCILNDQLSIRNDTLSKKQDVAEELEYKIKKYEAANKMKDLLDSLDDELNKTLNELSPQIVDKITTIGKVLEKVRNYLYVNKVKTPSNLEECNLFQKSVNRYGNILMKIVTLSGSVEQYQVLGEGVKQFTNSLKEITAIEDSVYTLNEDIGMQTIEKVSDILYHKTMDECD